MVYVISGVAHTGHKPQGDEYKREPTKFAHDGPLDLDAGDYHLYVCAACPWAHRALITRNLSATLRAKITVSVVSPFRDDDVGWEFLSDANKASVEQFAALPVTADQSPLKAKTL
jgi:glutathionyl-hydroquinone reductase